MAAGITRLLAGLPVGRKLLLIYLLDLSAVIYISTLLIDEKLTFIDFARKEIAGSHYIAAVRDVMFSAAAPVDPVAGRPAGASTADEVQQTVWRAEAAYGAGMKSAALADAYNRSLQVWFEQVHTPQGEADVIATGRSLIARIGDQSNLILDPDLDSYYTMSLVLLRFPELHDLLTQLAERARLQPGDRVDAARSAAALLTLQGRFDAAYSGAQGDYAEAATAGGARLAADLAPTRDRFAAAIGAFRRAAQSADGAQRAISVGAAEREADVALLAAWRSTDDALQRLLAARVRHLYGRMWLHLGTAAGLLSVILVLVYAVATSISRPLKRLAGVATEVSRSGDYAVRAPGSGSGEIGQVVTAFNRMLADLGRDREVRQELAATSRAEVAQRTLLEAFSSPLIVTSIPDHRVLHANPPAAPWLDGLHADPWAACLDPAARLRYFQRMSDVGSADGFEVLWRTREGYQWALLSGRRLRYSGEDALLTTITPINQIKLLEQRLELWSKVFEASSESIMILDTDRRILSANQSFVRTTGWDIGEVAGKTPEFLYTQRHEPSFYETLWAGTVIRGAWRGEVWFKRKNGDLFPNWLVANAVRSEQGTVTHYVVAASDITEHKASEERIQHLAHHDVLTDLPNRALCLELLRQAMHQATRDGTQVGVVCIDLDRFKAINDTLGHHAGDLVLRLVAKRLLQAVRTGDTVSRLGADEFVVVLGKVSGVDEVRSIIEDRIVPLLDGPQQIDGKDLQLTSSIGAAVYPQDGREVDYLLRNADAALQHAKETGRNRVVYFTAELHAQAQQRLAIERALDGAAARGEMQLSFQPRVHARTLDVLGVEALLRWTSPEHGDMSPVTFIPIAEETGQIVQLGSWVVGEACRQHRVWCDDGTGRVPVSVNLSAAQLRDPKLVEMIAAALAAHDMEPGALEVELTESLLMDDAIGTVDILQRIKALGVKMSIDDFGTGYSSLNYLNQFPIDKLKIDQSFVRDLAESPADLAIIQAIIGLGHALGLQVVAEGVEHVDVERLLAQAGCDELQGYLYAQPMASAALTRWLSGRVLAPPAVEGGALGLPSPVTRPAGTLLQITG